MKIFDSRWIGSHGIGRFASELQPRLHGFSPIALGGRPSSPFDWLALHTYLKNTRPQLYFSPGYNVPLGNPCPFVFCIHDLGHLHVDESSSVAKRCYYELLVRPAMARAQAVFTVSEFSRHSIADWAHVSLERVINVGNGVSEVFRPEGAVMRRERPYFLHVGNYRAHKNFERILLAFATSGLAGTISLIGTGMPTKEVRRSIARLKLDAEVEFTGGVSDEELAALYRGALGLVFVSCYEGFGLPIVEAMASGTPVLSSSVTAMPEVAGDSALLIDPLDVEAIQDGMRRLANDSTLRQQLRNAGLVRAKAFSWDLTGSRVNAALSAVSESPRP